jgi:hypothetical protein
MTTNVEECGPCLVFASFTLAFALQLRKKHGKTAIKLRKASEYIITKTATQTHTLSLYLPRFCLGCYIQIFSLFVSRLGAYFKFWREKANDNGVIIDGAMAICVVAALFVCLFGRHALFHKLRR